MPKQSAGILLFRRGPGGLEVLLAHPGGPYFAALDEGAWGIPKGEIEPGEAPLAVARREFEEETGHPAPPGEPIALGEIRQKGGKVVAGWALEGDVDPARAVSNAVRIEWPRRSGRFVEIPEIDRVAWFEPGEARRRIRDAQVPFLERLLADLGEPWPG